MSHIRISSRARLVGLAVALVGCGSGSVPLENVGASYGHAVCSKVFQCCNATEQMAVLDKGGLTGNITDEKSCEQVESGALMAFLYAPIDAAQKKGRVVYHGDRFGACMDAYQGLSCGDFSKGLKGSSNPMPLSMNMDCKTFLEPRVPVGQPCDQSFECIGGGSCDGATSGAGGMPAKDGTCSAPTATTTVKVGDPCQSNDGCLPMLRCDSATNTCQPLEAMGAQCQMWSDCMSSRCDTSMSPPSCGAKLANGAMCTVPWECTSGSCVFDNMSNSSTCKPLAADGSPCSASNDCQSGSCVYSSGSMGTCAAAIQCDGSGH